MLSWWPAARDLMAEWSYWCEVAADDAAGPQARLALANAMVKLLRESRPREGVATAGACALTPVIGRVELLLNLPGPPRRSLRRSLAKASLGLAIWAALALAPVGAAVHPHTHHLQALHPCPAGATLTAPPSQ